MEASPFPDLSHVPLRDFCAQYKQDQGISDLYMRKGVLSYRTSSIIPGIPPNHWVFQEIE